MKQNLSVSHFLKSSKSPIFKINDPQFFVSTEARPDGAVDSELKVI